MQLIIFVQVFSRVPDTAAVLLAYEGLTGDISKEISELGDSQTFKDLSSLVTDRPMPAA